MGGNWGVLAKMCCRIFCLQVVDVVAKSYCDAGRAPEPGQHTGDPAAGRVPQSGQAPGDPASSGTSAAGGVHEAGQGVGNPAAGSGIPPRQAPEGSLANSSPGGVARTNDEAACRAVGSNPTAVGKLTCDQQPARLAARQAAQVGLMPAMPSTWPIFGIMPEGHADAQVGLICAVGCQGAL